MLSDICQVSRLETQEVDALCLKMKVLAAMFTLVMILFSCFTVSGVNGRLFSVFPFMLQYLPKCYMLLEALESP